MQSDGLYSYRGFTATFASIGGAQNDGYYMI